MEGGSIDSFGQTETGRRDDASIVHSTGDSSSVGGNKRSRRNMRQRKDLDLTSDSSGSVHSSQGDLREQRTTSFSRGRRVTLSASGFSRRGGGRHGGYGQPYRSYFSRKSRVQRRTLLRQPWNSPVGAFSVAAVEVQRVWRGHLIRRGGGRWGLSVQADVKQAEHEREKGSRGRDRRKPPEEHEEEEGPLGSLRRRFEHHSQQMQQTPTGGPAVNMTAPEATAAAAAAEGTEPFYLQEHHPTTGASPHRRRSREAQPSLAHSSHPPFELWCATRLQAWWRGLLCRRRLCYSHFSIYSMAAMQLQHAWRTYQQDQIFRMSESASFRSGGATVSTCPSYERFRCAADTIQNAWRRVSFLRIFRFYRDMIRFHMQGDPAMLLRAINPTEAHFFDKAAGIHIRFRLGGVAFPPNLYYKVYTHSPVSDIGAFAPRDYSIMNRGYTYSDKRRRGGGGGRGGKGQGKGKASAQGGARGGVTTGSSNQAGERLEKAGIETTLSYEGSIRVGSRFFDTVLKRREGYELGENPSRDPLSKDREEQSSTQMVDMSQWYRRTENNGWRPITIKALAGAELDPVTRADNAKAIQPFHFSRIRRKEDVERRKRQRKRDWLMAIYKNGLAREAEGMEEEEEGEEGEEGEEQEEGERGEGGEGAEEDDDEGGRRGRGGRQGQGGRGGSGDDNGDDDGLLTDHQQLQQQSTLYEERGRTHGSSADHADAAYRTGLGGQQASGRDGSGGDLDGSGGAGWEEDVELLAWSKGLDYDAYVRNWKTLATSGPSESAALMAASG